MRVYKYVTMEAATKILEHGTLRCAAPSTFNDPFELQVFTKQMPINKQEFISELLRQFHEMQSLGERVTIDKVHIMSPIKSLIALYQAGELEQRTDEEFSSYLEGWMSEREITQRPSEWTRVVHHRLAKFMHVCCFSTNSCSPLMWSHYAGQHSGAALEFETEGKSGLLQTIRKIKYLEDFPESDDLKTLVAANLGRQMSKDYSERLLDQMSFTKSIEWSYENEWRAFAAASSDFSSLESFVAFPPETLKAIHLGCRADRDAGWRLVLLAKKLNRDVEVFSRSLDPTGFRLIRSLLVAGHEMPEE